MTIESFEESMATETPPNVSVYLQALWYDAKGNWQQAHHLVDGLRGKTAAAVHAYLHRVEGDNRNANYWYNRAERVMPDASLKEEWKSLVEEMLNIE